MKIIAYFLPQFYHTPENDKYWGVGFTDWNSVKSSKKYFPRHKSPLRPTTLGYYNLDNNETIEKLCKYSMESGVDGFCYWHYWFGNGFQTLEKVPEMHLENKSIEQDFFFSWANTSWTKSWVGDDSTIIFQQEYSEESAISHFNYLKSFFSDKRYLKYKGKPMFQVINPGNSSVKKHIFILEKMSIEYFGHGLHWIFPELSNIKELKGLSYSLVGFPPGEFSKNNTFFKIKRKMQKYGILKNPVVVSEGEYLNSFKKNQRKWRNSNASYIPCLLSGWDNTPRYGNKGFIIDAHISSLLKLQIDELNALYKEGKNLDFIFIKAWNEWAEGNILEDYSVNGNDQKPLTMIKKILNP
jgi:hypothetical protein